MRSESFAPTGSSSGHVDRVTHRRYFVDSPISAGKATLAGAEAHHLLHVMRAAAGTEVVLFDGSGAEFHSRVEKAGRSTVELTVLARVAVDRELPLSLTLGVALPKGNRQRWLVEKAVELGVARFVPLATQRCVVRPAADWLPGLRRVVVEASKQCGRNRLMEIAPPCRWRDFVGHSLCDPGQHHGRHWVAHPGGAMRFSPEPVAGGRDTARSCHTLLAVGPEGGWTAAEIRQAQHSGWEVIGLGPRVLRVETAALMLVAMATFSATAS